MKIYISERIQEDSFLDYIKNKLNLKNLEFLGYGAEGVTFAIDPYKVIKLTRTYPKDYEPFLNKKFNHLMNVYNIGEIDVPLKFIEKNKTQKIINFNVDNISSHSIESLKDNKIYYFIAERLYDSEYVNYDSHVMVKTVRRFLFINRINISYYDKIYDFFFNDAELLVDIKDEPSYIKDMYETMIKNIDNMTNEDMIYIKQLIEGFKELVNNNIYNFDLHPGNVLFNKDGVLKLIDYDYNIVIDKNLDNIYNKKYPMKNRVKI
jgi:hypothetical protein